MGLPLYKHTQWHDDALLIFGLVRLYIGKIFARCVYINTNARNDTTMQSTESPILFRSCGHETPFSDQKGASKIGDSVLCDDALLFVSDWKYLQDGLKKIQTHAMTRRCVAFCFGLVRLYRGKIFARWVYKNTNARKLTQWQDDALLVVSDWCVCIEVKYLQDGFTKIQTHAMRLEPELGIPDFISFMRARNPVLGPKRGIKKIDILKQSTGQSTESQIFDAPFGRKTGFRARMSAAHERNKIGDSFLCSRALRFRKLVHWGTNR